MRSNLGRVDLDKEKTIASLQQLAIVIKKVQ